MNIDWSGLTHWVNDAYKPLYRDWERFNCILGGSGSGKSFAIVQRAIFRIITVPGYNLLVARKYGVTNRFSTFALFRQIIGQWNLESLFVVNKSDMTITCTASNNQVLFLGMDSEDKIKSITFRSGVLSAVWLEEANEFADTDLQQINLRLRGQSTVPFQITVSFNPVSAFHWLKSYFVDNQPESCTLLKTTYKDNKFIDDGYRKQLEALKGTAYQVYALGEWGVTEGLVFKDFKVSEVPDNAKLYGYGMDFGFSSDELAMVALWVRGDEIYLDEMIYQTGLTNSDIMRKLKSMNINQHARIVADSAEPKSIEELYRAGFNIHPCKKGPDSIRYGIDLMQSKQIFITPQSRNIQKEFYSYTWKQDKNGRYLPEPVDCLNHAIDASRYVVTDMIKAYTATPAPTSTRSAFGM